MLLGSYAGPGLFHALQAVVAEITTREKERSLARRRERGARATITGLLYHEYGGSVRGATGK